ncbi:hypothetical protein DEF23_07175, partial [Marinitenerispora sediminis]
EPSRPGTDTDTTPSEPADRTPESPARDEPPADTDRPVDRNDTDTAADRPDSESADTQRTPDRDADAEANADANADQETRAADADASDPLRNPENLPTTRQMQEYLIERFRQDLDLAELAHPEGIIGEIHDRQRALVNAGLPEGRAEMSIGDRPGGGPSPDLSPSARLDTPSGGGPSGGGPDLPSTDRGSTGTIDTPGGGSGPSSGGPDLPSNGRGDGPGGLPDDGGSSDRGGSSGTSGDGASNGDGPWKPIGAKDAPEGYVWVRNGDMPYIRRLPGRQDLPALEWDWETGDFQNATPREREYFPRGATREQAFDALISGNNSSFQKFVDVLKDLKLIDASNVDADGRPLDVLNAMRDPSGQSYDNIRHYAKEEFRNAIVRHVLDPQFVTADPRFEQFRANGLDEDQALRATSHQMMLEVSGDLAPSDRGSLGESWYREMYAQDGETQVTISRAEAEAQGFELQSNRRLDIVEGNTAFEIKNYTGKLGTEQIQQLGDLIEITGHEVRLKDGSFVPVDDAVVVFPDPAGVRSNAQILSDLLDRYEDASIEIEIHNDRGESLRVSPDKDDVAFLSGRGTWGGEPGAATLEQWLTGERAVPDADAHLRRDGVGDTE